MNIFCCSPIRSINTNGDDRNEYDPSISPEYDIEYPLVQGNTVCGSNLDESSMLKKHPMLLEFVELAREQFPDYKYLPYEQEKQALYPLQMSADELAGAILDLARDFDGYHYMDSVENPEAQLMDMKYVLLRGLGHQEYSRFLKDVREESEELAPRAEDQRAFDYNLLQEKENDRRAYIVEFSIFYAQADQLMSVSETIFLGDGGAVLWII